MWKKKIRTCSNYLMQHIRKLLPLIWMVLILLCLSGCEEIREDPILGIVRIPTDTEQYRDLMREACEAEGIPEYENLLMAIMATESSGSDVTDVMQALESLGLPRNSLGVEESIRQGVRYFKSLLEKAEDLGVDLKSVIQAYNYGSGFLDYVSEKNSGIYNEELAVTYSQLMQQRYQTKVYGNPYYVTAVSKYISFVGEEEGNGNFAALMDVARIYEGAPYVFGGTGPSSFDCSGFTRHVYAEIGIHLPRTAQGQYYASTHVTAGEAEPGDLIFFTRTYKTSLQITHVGIYVGDGRMYHAGGSGVGYSDVTSEYWNAHFAGFGRVW